MCSEIQELVEALKAQTIAINNLAESNALLVQAMSEAGPEEEHDFSFDLSGKPIGGAGCR